MANGNGTTVWKVLGSIALVLTVVSGAWALSATVGPKQRLDDHERRLQESETVCKDFTAFKGEVAADIRYIRETLTEIKRKLP